MFFAAMHPQCIFITQNVWNYTDYSGFPPIFPRDFRIFQRDYDLSNAKTIQVGKKEFPHCGGLLWEASGSPPSPFPIPKPVFIVVLGSPLSKTARTPHFIHLLVVSLSA